MLWQPDIDTLLIEHVQNHLLHKHQHHHHNLPMLA
jgi:hypothetical protein